MSETIQDLYTSFSEQMEPIQEDSRYFRYLFEMAQASGTTIEQQREELVKVVDEEWISMIEDSLDAINTIIEKPRRFITTEEEVVPVSLAKKISADSVRHLSQNTQFLAPSEDGGVHPTRILNVNTVETYDLYENRFIYHLIQRLLTFVDKRTDVIFWSTGNEIRNRFKMHSKIDDAYEQIEYSVEMTVKNRQSFAENDADNMDVFMRIDRVRRLVMALRGASFCQIMNGCSAVRSPIQRTNLIMKDPNYRKCYQLWQFMERYDKVGYNIDVQQQALAFDDEYMVQMYTNLINNYTVFKSLTDDERNLQELESVQHAPVAPKFIKEIKEVQVDSPDLPDVEELRASLEDVEAGKKAAEDAAAEARETAAAQLERMRAEADAEVSVARADADARVAAAEQTAAEQVARVKSESAAALAAKTAADAAELQAAKDAAAAELAGVREASAKELAEVHAKLDAAKLQIEEVRLAAERDARAAQETADVAAAEAEQKLADTVAAAEEKVAAAQQAADAAIDAARAAADSAVEQATVDASEKVAAAAAERDAAARAAEEARADADARIAAAELEAGERIEQELAAAKAAHERELEAARAEMQQRLASLAHELEQAERDRARAERRAEGNSLSRYLLARLRGEAAEGDVATTVEGDETDVSASDATDVEPSAKDADK